MEKKQKRSSHVEGQPEGMTQEEVAKELGIQRSLVGQIERAALKKIRTKLKNRRINKEDLI